MDNPAICENMEFGLKSEQANMKDQIWITRKYIYYREPSAYRPILIDYHINCIFTYICLNKIIFTFYEFFCSEHLQNPPKFQKYHKM